MNSRDFNLPLVDFAASGRQGRIHGVHTSLMNQSKSMPNRQVVLNCCFCCSGKRGANTRSTRIIDEPKRWESLMWLRQKCSIRAAIKIRMRADVTANRKGSHAGREAMKNPTNTPAFTTSNSSIRRVSAYFDNRKECSPSVLHTRPVFPWTNLQSRQKYLLLSRSSLNDGTPHAAKHYSKGHQQTSGIYTRLYM
ncbi:unnamed protein product [Ectocarpus sp. 4 AP-2014]